MLNPIAGVYPPEKGGKVIIDGINITDLKEYEHSAHVGRVYQDPNIGTAARMTIRREFGSRIEPGKKEEAEGCD